VKKHQSPEVVERKRQQFEAWLKRNPSKQFKDYFAEKVKEQFANGKPHLTLGRNLRGGEFSTSGENFFKQLQRYGLKSGDTCIDYGCGTLRIGLHVIRFLQPSAYWGFEIDDFLLKEGRKLIGEKLWKEKRPNLRVISPGSVAEASSCKADMLFSHAVMFHVHPAELVEYVNNVMSLIKPSGQAIIVGPWMDKMGDALQFSGQSWTHALPLLTEFVKRKNGRVEVLNEKDYPLEAFGQTAKIGTLRVTLV
jgi:SAM-dependent methyltransferase